MLEMTVTELDKRRREGSPTLVIDVRELWEREVASVDGTVHMPMNEIPGRLEDLKSLLVDDQQLVVMCHSGQRSMTVAKYLQQNGFDTVFNLTGGIDAWARHVDDGVARY